MLVLGRQTREGIAVSFKNMTNGQLLALRDQEFFVVCVGVTPEKARIGLKAPRAIQISRVEAEEMDGILKKAA